MDLRPGQKFLRYLLPLLLVVLSSGIPAAEEGVPLSSPDAPLIALIIDDLGHQRSMGERTVKLQGPVACAILPHTPFARYLANAAHASGKEVMLHMPLQPAEELNWAGPGEIGLDTSYEALGKLVEHNLEAVPHVVGVNNHMGSMLTRHPGHMHWLMSELRSRGQSVLCRQRHACKQHCFGSGNGNRRAIDTQGYLSGS